MHVNIIPYTRKDQLEKKMFFNRFFLPWIFCSHSCSMRFVYSGFNYEDIVPSKTANSMAMFTQGKPAEIARIPNDVDLSLSLFENWCEMHLIESNCYVARMFDVDVCIYGHNGDILSTKSDLWCFACSPTIIYAIDIQDGGAYSRHNIVGAHLLQTQQ